MRRRVGDSIAVFNGRDGEWQAVIAVKSPGKPVCYRLRRTGKGRAQSRTLWLVFSLLKRGPVDLIAEKATELGVSRLCLELRAHQYSEVQGELTARYCYGGCRTMWSFNLPEIDDPQSLEAFIRLAIGTRSCSAGRDRFRRANRGCCGGTRHGLPDAGTSSGLRAAFRRQN